MYKFLATQNKKAVSTQSTTPEPSSTTSPSATSPSTTISPSTTTSPSTTISPSTISAPTTSVTTTSSTISAPTTSATHQYPKRAQVELVQKLDFLNHDIGGLYKRKSAGMLSSNEENNLKLFVSKKLKIEKELKKKIDEQRRARLFRERKKAKNISQQTNSSVVKHGRPPIEIEQPGLLEAIIEIARCGYSTADSHRSSDIYRSIKTLNELQDALENQGFSLSRSGLYTRLLPKRSFSNEGRRHVTTVPVKLTRCLNTEHAQHKDSMFCMTTINHLRQIASFLGPLQSVVISQDDKCRIPLGITAANKQAPIVMHVDYKVSVF